MRWKESLARTQPNLAFTPLSGSLEAARGLYNLSLSSDADTDAYIHSVHELEERRANGEELCQLSLVNACWETRWLVGAMGLKLALLSSYDSASDSGDGPPSLMDVDVEFEDHVDPETIQLVPTEDILQAIARNDAALGANALLSDIE